MKISTISALFLSLFTTALVFAQDTIPGNGIFTPGTSYSYEIMKSEPVCWINKANEFNAYIPGKVPLLLTLQNEKPIDIGEHPKFTKVMTSNYSFMLSTEDNKAYYFTTEGLEQMQTLELMKNFGSEIVKILYGYGYAKHTVDNVSLEKLKAAKSVYDVLGK